jgi:hypothetical protein
MRNILDGSRVEADGADDGDPERISADQGHQYHAVDRRDAGPTDYRNHDVAEADRRCHAQFAWMHAVQLQASRTGQEHDHRRPDGRVFWNDDAIDLVTLRAYLARTLEYPTEPELHLRPAPEAPYGSVNRVLAVIDRSGVSGLGIIGNEGYARF